MRNLRNTKKMFENITFNTHESGNFGRIKSFCVLTMSSSRLLSAQGIRSPDAVLQPRYFYPFYPGSVRLPAAGGAREPVGRRALRGRRHDFSRRNEKHDGLHRERAGGGSGRSGQPERGGANRWGQLGGGAGGAEKTGCQDSLMQS
jgi:hypothetical protein